VFDPTITGTAIGRAEDRLKAEFKDPSFQLQFYSPEDCIARREQLNQLIDPRTGKLLRDLTQEEIRWIRSERAICRHNFLYFLERYTSITRFDGSTGACSPNVAQRIILDIWAEHERKQTAIEEMDLKARQLGVTTLVQQYVVHQTNFIPGTHAVIGSADEEASHEMANKAEFTRANMPWWMQAKLTTFWAGERWEFGDQNSSIAVAWLNQKTGIARGRTPLICHLTEVAYALDPEKHIEASLMRAMHPSPRMMLILESTANGMFNWWHSKWEAAIKGWESGASRLRPRFLPWYVGTDIYPTETWLRAHPVPEKWKPAQLTVRHAQRARDYVATNPLLRKYLGDGWTMPQAQMWWWENTREEYRSTGILNRFYTELPSDDKESFQAQQHSVFETELISAYREKVETPKMLYGLVAKPDLIPTRLQPARPQFDPRFKPVDLRCRNGNEYRFQPLVFQGYTATDPDRKVFIWELPKDNCEYGFGADTGYGISQDRSVIEVMRKATISECARLVAEFASDQVSASDLAPICQAIAQLYTVPWKGILRQPKAVVECNSNGETCQVLLRKMGYSRFHNWVRYSKKNIDPSKATSLGAFTNQWSRAMVLEFFVKAVRDLFIDIDSPWLIQEMATLGQSKTKKLQAEEGGFDDRVMAAGWVFLSLHLLDANSYAPLFGTRRLEDEAGPKIYEEWQPDEQYGVTGPGLSQPAWPGAKWRM
jgi:hypothetical protein